MKTLKIIATICFASITAFAQASLNQRLLGIDANEVCGRSVEKIEKIQSGNNVFIHCGSGSVNLGTGKFLESFLPQNAPDVSKLRSMQDLSLQSVRTFEKVDKNNILVGYDTEYSLEQLSEGFLVLKYFYSLEGKVIYFSALAIPNK